jgi:16S rRNA U516 pseudouridylate synthase RsuA-like enzyme
MRMENIHLGKLKEGEVRELTDEEVKCLYEKVC